VIDLVPKFSNGGLTSSITTRNFHLRAAGRTSASNTFFANRSSAGEPLPIQTDFPVFSDTPGRTRPENAGWRILKRHRK